MLHSSASPAIPAQPQQGSWIHSSEGHSGKATDIRQAFCSNAVAIFWSERIASSLHYCAVTFQARSLGPQLMQPECRCPECAHGSIDMANDGNGRWQGEWFAVPCHTGDTPMHYSIVVSSYYWFSMVISNSRYAAAIGSMPLERMSFPRSHVEALSKAQVKAAAA